MNATEECKLDEMIQVMQACKDGKEIEFVHRIPLKLIDDNWRMNTPPKWDWDNFNYRVKTKSGKDKLIEDIQIVIDNFSHDTQGQNQQRILLVQQSLINGEYHD